MHGLDHRGGHNKNMKQHHYMNMTTKYHNKNMKIKRYNMMSKHYQMRKSTSHTLVPRERIFQSPRGHGLKTGTSKRLAGDQTQPASKDRWQTRANHIQTHATHEQTEPPCPMELKPSFPDRTQHEESESLGVTPL